MTDYEKVHFLTEAIYKNVLENFNPGVKQLISTGRQLQKALHNVTTQAKAYIECIYTLAQSAQVCKGATSDIGAALLQIAEVHKEINTQVIDNIKSFHSDLLIPLETKQENDFKHLQLVHKKYSAGHKFHQSAHDKAQSALKKHKKKHKAKYGFDQKELQHAREVKESYQKLEEYQFQNLRLALLEERKRYCFLLDRVCAMVRNYASHHSKAQELFTHRLSEWSELCKASHILPESSEGVISALKNQDDLYTTAEEVPGLPERRTSMEYEHQQSGSGHGEDSGSFTYGTAHRLQGVVGGDGNGEPYPNIANGLISQEPDYSGSLHRGITMPTGPPENPSQVRALYTHSGTGETQLSFVTGDLISIIGDRRDGWQYGENNRTYRLGWFPISFTEPMQLDGSSRDFRLTTQRVKSLGNLADLRDFNQDYHMGGIHSSGHSDSDSVNVRLRENRENRQAVMGERPKSIHVPPSVHMPPKLRFGKSRDHQNDDQSWGKGSFGKRSSFHPKQPSIPEDDKLSTSPPPQLLQYHNLCNNFAPMPHQRHTLAYATSPVTDIYMGRRHSTIEQLSQQLRSNSLLPGSRLRDVLNEAPEGPSPSLIRPEGATPSAFTKVQEGVFIPPPEEFRDASGGEDRSACKRSHLARQLAESHVHQVTGIRPAPQDSLPPPPPPLPPPNHPPPTGVPPGGQPQYHTRPIHAPLMHTASSPALVRSVRIQTQPSHPGMAPQTYIHTSQPNPASTPTYASTHGLVPRHHSNNNPDYMTRTEMSHLQMAPPATYNSSTASPANSSSGYSSGTTHASSNPGDLPPPPPPPHTPTPSPPPPPPPVPPPNPGMENGAQSGNYMTRRGTYQKTTHAPQYF